MTLISATAVSAFCLLIIAGLGLWASDLLDHWRERREMRRPWVAPRGKYEKGGMG